MNPKEFYDLKYGGDVARYGDEFAERTPETGILHRILQRYTVDKYELTEENLPGHGRLLDLGCGTGKYLPAMSIEYDEVWGVDFLAAQTGGDDKIQFKVADLNERLDFASGYFDCVTILSVLEHLFDPFAIIRECHRLLRPGGTLIVQVPNVAFVMNRLRLAGGKLPVTAEGDAWDGGHLHYFTRASLRQLLEKEGFSIIKITSGGPFRKIRNIWGSFTVL